MTASSLSQDFHEEFLDSVNQAIDQMTLGVHDEAPTRIPRFRRIVTAYDGSDGAKLALAWTTRLARLYGSEVLVANAYTRPNLTGGASIGTSWYPDYAELYEAAESWARDLADETATQIREHDIKATAYSFEGGAAREIGKLARDKGADLVVTGAARRSGVARLFLGSTAMSLLEHAPCSVLIARNTPPVPRILTATDGSSVSYQAVAHALSLASDLRAELVVEHVLEFPEQASGREPEGLLQKVVATIQLPTAPPRVRYVMDAGNPATRILQRGGEEDAGLLVLGAHGRNVVERALLGSTSRRVATGSHASVLVVKAL